MKNYHNEAEGQREFYERIGVDPDLSHNTDGVDRGNLYENKLLIDNINKVLLQAIKYASRIRIRGEKLPLNIILNDLNREKVYIFKSSDLLEDIEKVYFGAASKYNDNYSSEAKYKVIDYSTSKGLQELLVYVNSENFVKYHITKDNIVGLSIQFYKKVQDKDKLLKGKDAEIRKPNILKDRVLPYEKNSNIEFEDIMDVLNPNLLQREQGAYYTPVPYVKEMQKMLLQAIKEIPKNKDYVIIDRCAGTGNLEEGLPDEVLKHCILSTIEFNEYVILNYKYGDKCLVVIPNTDALEYDIIPAEHNTQGVKNDFIREKVEDDKCVIILVENPPFSEAGSGGSQKTGQKENKWKESYVMQEMKKEIKGAPLNELANLFIWSGFHYYLRNETDSYILYSPTKYWRNQKLVSKKFMGGFLCNRKEFHATQVSATACIWWKNIDDNKLKKIKLTPYNIINEKLEIASNDIVLQKAEHMLSELYDRRPQQKDDTEDGLMCEKNGYEFLYDDKKVSVSKPLYNKNIIGYIQCHSFSIDRKTIKLVRGIIYDAHGFYLRSDNFVKKIPIFVAGCFPYDKWYITDVYSKSSDLGEKYCEDKEFLKQCLIYTALSQKNRCLSLKTKKRSYINELCFDKQDTLIWNETKKLTKNFPFTDEEKDLLKYWDDVLYEVHKTEEYKNIIKKIPKARIGMWQIENEINIKVDKGKRDKNGNVVLEIKYTELNTKMITMNNKIEEYYKRNIIKNLFKYELIK